MTHRKNNTETNIKSIFNVLTGISMSISKTEYIIDGNNYDTIHPPISPLGGLFVFMLFE